MPVQFQNQHIAHLYNRVVQDRELNKGEARQLKDLVEDRGVTPSERRDVQALITYLTEQCHFNPQGGVVQTLQSILQAPQTRAPRRTAGAYTPPRQDGLAQEMKELRGLALRGSSRRIASKAEDIFGKALQQGDSNTINHVLHTIWSLPPDRREDVVLSFTRGDNLSTIARHWNRLSEHQQRTLISMAYHGVNGAITRRSHYNLFCNTLKNFHDRSFPPNPPEPQPTPPSRETSTRPTTYDEPANEPARERLQASKIELTSSIANNPQLQIAPELRTALHSQVRWRDIRMYTGELGKETVRGFLNGVSWGASGRVAGRMADAADRMWDAYDSVVDAQERQRQFAFFSGENQNIMLNKDTGEVVGTIEFSDGTTRHKLSFQGTVDPEHIRNGVIQGMNIEDVTCTPLR